MIRIRGPVGTLRVLMLPGEPDPSLQGASGRDPEALGAGADPMREVWRDE